MQKWILIFVVPFLFHGLARSQDQVGCSQILEDAKEAYEAGMVDVVPALLNPCLESGLSGSAKQEAYILVINAYLFDYLPDRADTLMGRFLDEYPNYLSRTSDPAEFTMLLNTHKQRREEARIEAERQARLAEQARIQEQARIEELRKEQSRNERKGQRRQAGVQGGPGIGFVLGANLSMPQIIEIYSVSDPSSLNPEFSSAGPGLHFGASGVIPVSDRLETSVALLYQRALFSYSATPFDHTRYEYTESQNRFAIPVTLLVHLNPEGYNRVYLKAGIVADYLLSASATANRYLAGSENSIPVAAVGDTDVVGSRARMNISGIAAAGLRFPVGGGFIFGEAGYQFGFLQVNDASGRYDNPDFLWQVYHIDPDFRLHHLFLSAGMIFYLR